MKLCEKCNQRPAMIYMSRVENGKQETHGFCMQCAKEMGIPFNDAMKGMIQSLGMSPEDLTNAMEELSQQLPTAEGEAGEEDTPHGTLPLDFSKIFGNLKNQIAEQNQVQNDPDGPAVDHRPGVKKNTEPRPTILPKFGKNLTQLAKDGRLDSIVGRDQELSRVIQILCRRQKNNPCLLGEPGVGKTAIAEGLAQRIADGNVPYKLLKKQIWLLDMTAVVAGTQFRGQFEARMQGILKEVLSLGNIILVIDEIHTIVGAGDHEGSMNAGNILKPALSRGEVQVIGATTLTEYRKYIEKDAALERRFQPVIVNEPSIEDTVRMLDGIKHYYEDFHSVHITQELLKKIVVLSERYISDRYLPDKAIDLLDEAASARSLASAALNDTLKIRDQLLQLKLKREELENQTGDEKIYEEITRVQSEEMRLSSELEKLEPDTKAIQLTEDDVAKVIELWTGIPASSITQNEAEKMNQLADRLKQVVIGQDTAVDAVSMAILRNRAGISVKKRPVSFIFAGPTGVGKTELVKRLAQDLFHAPESLIRLDMSEFMEKHSVSRIIGAPPGYVGFDEAGQLTEKIRRKPYSVVLFDEIEKAHPDVLNILLQILDDGRITDAGGRTVNFENAVIVMTTNAGSQTGTTPGFLSADKAQAMKTEKALSAFLRPEFMNRVDEIITFRSLEEADFVRIAELRLKEFAQVLEEKNIAFTYTPEVSAFVAKESYSHAYGARNMARFIQKNMENPMAQLLMNDYGHSIQNISAYVEQGEIRFICK